MNPLTLRQEIQCSVLALPSAIILLEIIYQGKWWSSGSFPMKCVCNREASVGNISKRDNETLLSLLATLIHVSFIAPSSRL